MANLEVGDGLKLELVHPWMMFNVWGAHVPTIPGPG